MQLKVPTVRLGHVEFKKTLTKTKTGAPTVILGVVELECNETLKVDLRWLSYSRVSRGLQL